MVFVGIAEITVIKAEVRYGCFGGNTLYVC